MKTTVFHLFIFVSLLFLSSCKEKAVTQPIIDELEIDLTAEEKELVAELNSTVNHLEGASPTLDYSDISVFNQFADARVIGLGEATHGTKEFFQMKHRLFKYFAEQHGFRIFGFEADMGECIYIDRFITKGIGTIDQVMGKMHFWTWKTKEVKDLILWMRDYNSGKNESSQIHLLGVDCQFVTYNQDLIEEYLNKYSTTIPSDIKQILNEITSIGERRELPANTTKNDIKLKCDSVRSFFKTSKNSWIAGSGQLEYDLITRLVEQTKQFLDVLTGTSYNYRDFYMAENTIWLTTLLGNNTKVVSWAHNGHLAKDAGYGTGSQGYHLSQNIGINYKAIGFSFSTGSFQAVNYDPSTKQYTGLVRHTINQLPQQDSYNYIFHAVVPENFILIHSDINTSDKLYQWYNAKRKFISIGAVYNIELYENYFYSYNLINAFDAVIHIKKTTSAIAL